MNAAEPTADQILRHLLNIELRVTDVECLCNCIHATLDEALDEGEAASNCESAVRIAAELLKGIRRDLDPVVIRRAVLATTPEEPVQVEPAQAQKTSPDENGPKMIDAREVQDLAEDLIDTSEGIIGLAGDVGDDNYQERMSGIRALAKHLDGLVTRLADVAEGSKS